MVLGYPVVQYLQLGPECLVGQCLLVVLARLVVQLLLLDLYHLEVLVGQYHQLDLVDLFLQQGL